MYVHVFSVRINSEVGIFVQNYFNLIGCCKSANAANISGVECKLYVSLFLLLPLYYLEVEKGNSKSTVVEHQCCIAAFP